MTIPELSGSYDSAIVIRRWAAMWLDLLAVLLLLGCFGLAFPSISEDLEVLLLFVVPTLYHTLLEGLSAFTPGKWLAGIRVTTATGDLPGLRRGFVRTLLRLIEVNPILAGGLPAGLIANYTRLHQRLGDILAGTYVVQLQDLHSLFPSTPVAASRGPYSNTLEKRGGSDAT